MLLLASAAQAQGAYSMAGANRYVQSKNWTGLVQYSTGWTRAQPNESMAWYYLGSAYEMGLHQPGNAVAPLQKAVALKPDWALGWTALGFANMDLKHFDDAADAFAKAVEYAPAKSNYWNNLASAYSWANKPGLAEQTLEKQERQAGPSATDVDWYNLGNGYANLNRRDRAINAYRQALRLNPRNGLAWNNLGVAEQAMGNLQNALVDYQKAAALGDSLANNNIANVQAATAPRSGGGGGGGYNPQRVLESIRKGQAHAWEINHPGQMNNPYGRPL
jgi:tetratricopeptide (TPR) repeat protein